MSVTVGIGLLLALATAFTSVVGFLYKHRGAVESPPIDGRRPVSSMIALFRSRAWIIGLVVATGSWGFHVAALALAPISLVQSVIAGGLVMLTVVADRLFGLTVTRREWIGVALTAIGLAFLAATLDGVASEAHNTWSAPTLSTYVAVSGGLGMVVTIVFWGRSAFALAIAAGLLWGASDVSIKALSAQLDTGLAVLVHPLAAVILVASLIGLVVSARSLQDGRPVPIIAGTSAAANLITIASGPIVFDEPVPDDPLGLTLRLLAFALVIVAASLTPAPVRAANA